MSVGMSDTVTNACGKIGKTRLWRGQKKIEIDRALCEKFNSVYAICNISTFYIYIIWSRYMRHTHIGSMGHKWICFNVDSITTTLGPRRSCHDMTWRLQEEVELIYLCWQQYSSIVVLYSFCHTKWGESDYILYEISSVQEPLVSGLECDGDGNCHHSDRNNASDVSLMG